MMKEEDAMVYRRPYLTSGSSGFALNAISRAMKKDLKVSSFLYLWLAFKSLLNVSIIAKGPLRHRLMLKP